MEEALLTKCVMATAFALLAPTPAASGWAEPAMPEPVPALALSGPTRLTAPDGDVEWLFGSSLAVNDQYVVIGARWADHIRGAVYVYRRLPAGETESPRLALMGRLVGADVVRGFGWSVAISGSTVAVGSTSDVTSRGRGEAYVFDLTNLGPDLSEQVRIPTPPRAGGFGSTIALAGDLLVVGGPRSDVERGAAFVYRRPSTGWKDLNPDDVTKLKAPEAQFGSRFGASVATDGEVVLVGAPRFDGGDGEGAVFIFAPTTGWSAGTLQPTAVLTALPDYSIGANLALTSRSLIAGAAPLLLPPGHHPATVLVFGKPASGWSSPPFPRLAELWQSDPAPRDVFGGPISTDGRVVAVGAPGDPLGGYEPPGAVYLFVRPTTGWRDHPGSEDLKLTPPQGAMGDRFGSSVGLNSGVLLVGAISETGGGAVSEGAAYAYGIGGDSVLGVPTLAAVGVVTLAALLGFAGMVILMVGRAV